MKKRFLILKQLDRQFDMWRRLQDEPREGWIRLIRKAIGMTTKQLAKRLNVNRSRVVKIEQSEPEHSLTLKTLHETAEALNCKLVYALVPKEPLQDMLEKQAKKIASKRLHRVSHSMLLEDQSVEPIVEQEQLQQLIKILLSGSFKHLWDDE